MFLSALRTVLAIFALLTTLGCVDERGDSRAESNRTGARLAVLSPACAIILKDLGREDHVVARHGWDLALDADLPVAGDQSGLDYETLLRVDPTDIVLERSQQDIPERLREYADEYGWRVHTIPMLTLDDVRGAIGAMDRISSGSETMSEAGGRLLRRFESAVTPDGAPAGALGRTLPIMGTDPVSVLGPGSFHAQLLESLGAESLPREGASHVRLDTEDVIRMDPDSIVLIVPGLDEAGVDEALGSLADVDLRALREGRVLLVNHPHALTPSTSLIEVARNIAEACEAMAPAGDAPPGDGPPGDAP